MERGCTSKYSTLIDRLLIEDLAPRKMNELRGHMASCPACQQRYNRVVLASRLLEGGPATLKDASPRELGWVGQAVMDRTRLVPDSKPARRGVLAWATGLAAVAAVATIALIVVPMLRGASSVEDEGFQARGTPARVSPQVGLRAFCIQRQTNAGEPTVVEASIDPAVFPADAPSCEVTDILRFAYTNKSSMRYLFLVGLDSKLGIKWYEPHPPRLTSIRVRQQVADEPLSRAVQLKVNHERGPVRLFAIFSKSPLAANQIKQAVAGARRAHTPLERLQVLPLEDTEQRSILVNLSR